jgi:hypothetical protein
MTQDIAKVEQACEILHEAYELAAVEKGWQTNPRSRRPWSQVPVENKETMRQAVGVLLDHLSQSDLFVNFPFTRPTITTLCGSTWFKDAFIRANKELTLKGHIVLSCGLFGHADNEKITPPQKVLLDQLHLFKILMSDDILVLNVNGYIGESTHKEIQFALTYNKPVRYLEEPRDDDTRNDNE